MIQRKKILVAMSGGVDSSLAAAILEKEGHYVIGATMKLWPKKECGEDFNEKACCSLKGIEDARSISSKLGIPHYVFDFHREFKNDIIDYFCDEYARGYTPNPCIVCNQKIKFRLLLRKAKELGCKCIATGHYAKVGYSRLKKRYFISEGDDKEKDQSYFLSFLSQDSIGRAIFPLGNMTKNHARDIARKLGLTIHDKRSSQEICFVRGHYSDYLREYCNVNFIEGDILHSSGKKIGRHKGIHHYTIGQRRGLGIAHTERLYVTHIDREQNTISVGPRDEILRSVFVVRDPSWCLIDGTTKSLRTMCRIRYTHKKAEAIVEKMDSGRFKVSFLRPQAAPTPGQAAVFYEKDRILGAGWIERVIK